VRNTPPSTSRDNARLPASPAYKVRFVSQALHVVSEAKRWETHVGSSFVPLGVLLCGGTSDPYDRSMRPTGLWQWRQAWWSVVSSSTTVMAIDVGLRTNKTSLGLWCTTVLPVRTQRPFLV